MANVNDSDFNALGVQNCFSLTVELKSEGVLGGPRSKKISYALDSNKIKIEIEQYCIRTLKFTAASPIQMERMWDFYSKIERLLMLFDGRFYYIESICFTGNATSQEEYDAYANECSSRRLSYYKTDPIYCYTHHCFLNFNAVLSPELISKWIKLQDELDIVHQVALYNIADTGITHDVKCANFIECLEAIAEIIGVYDTSFSAQKYGKRKITLRMYIDDVISKYGKDIFPDEYSINKDAFLQILVNTRHRIMHIKRKQPDAKYLSGAQSILYLIKLCHLYRVVLLSLLGIDYSEYQSKVNQSIKEWNDWNGVLSDFISKLK